MEQPVEPTHVTVQELIRHLSMHDPDKPVHFGCEELEFLRVKDRGDAVQVEFGQTVYLDSNSEDYRVVVDHHGHPRVSKRKMPNANPSA